MGRINMYDEIYEGNGREHAGKYPAEKCTFKENKNLRGRDYGIY